MTLNVTEQELNIILASLGKQPAEIVMAIILKLQQQAHEQQSNETR